jgi:hypothetical protein
MKRLRQLFAVTILMLLLTNVALADEGVMYPGVTPPPPSTTTTGVMYPGFAPTGGTELQSEVPVIDLETEITLLLIQNMLALF